MKNLIDKVYILLPVLLWPMVFIVFKNFFVYAMFVATLILASFSLIRYRSYLPFTRNHSAYQLVGAGIVSAIALYLIFYLGYDATKLLGINGLVADVYTMLYSANSKVTLAILLIFIGIFEEIYWRGGIQTFAEKRFRWMNGNAWLAAAFYYGAVHLSTLNPILAISALFVGLVTGFVAKRYGLAASMITHILWIEAIVVLIPIGV